MIVLITALKLAIIVLLNLNKLQVYSVTRLDHGEVFLFNQFQFKKIMIHSKNRHYKAIKSNVFRKGTYIYHMDFVICEQITGQSFFHVLACLDFHVI